MGVCEFWLLTFGRRFVISVKPYRGQFVREVWGWTQGPYPQLDVLLDERRRPSVKKVKVGDRSSVKHLAAMESEMMRDRMAVVEALAMLQYDDGSPRQPGYLGVWTQGSAWVVRLTDKDAEASLTAEGRTLDEAMELLHMLLGAEDAPWEPMGRRKKKGG